MAHIGADGNWASLPMAAGDVQQTYQSPHPNPWDKPLSFQIQACLHTRAHIRAPTPVRTSDPKIISKMSSFAFNHLTPTSSPLTNFETPWQTTQNDSLTTPWWFHAVPFGLPNHLHMIPAFQCSSETIVIPHGFETDSISYCSFVLVSSFFR